MKTLETIRCGKFVCAPDENLFDWSGRTLCLRQHRFIRRPSQHRHHLHRRHGLRRHRPVRRQGLRHAATSTAWPPRARGSPTSMSAQAVCSACRAALMTGCYPNRVGILGALGPHAQDRHHRRGDDPRRALQAEGLRHGHLRQVAPGRSPEVPADPARLRRILRPALLQRHVAAATPTSATQGLSAPAADRERARSSTPTSTGDDQDQLTTLYTEHAVRFIDRHKDQPFFLYVPHSMVHVPLHVSDKFRGKSRAGCSATS